MKKRLIFLVLCIAFVCALLAGVVAAEGELLPFLDVPEDSWFYDGVQYAYSLGLMKGTSDTTFNPAGTTTRGMIVTILYRMEGEPFSAVDCPFIDVKQGSYYQAAIAWGAENGIVNGYSADRFAPDEIVKREQMAAIMYRYALFKQFDVEKQGDISGYSDYVSVSSYAREAMAWANSYGLITGTSSTMLSPSGAATRAQTATIIGRFLQKNQEQTESEQTPGRPAQSSGAGQTQSGSGAAEQKPEKTYEGIDANVANKKSDNLFLLSETPIADGVEVTLTLCGNVKLCGFDIRVLFDAQELKLREVREGDDLPIYTYSNETEGSVAVNFAAANNISGEKSVLTLVFDAADASVKESVISLKAIELVMTDLDYETIAAPYTLTYCKATMQE